MTVQDYSVTLAYGATVSPYSKEHPHRGVDYGCPDGTELVIGTTVLGLSGHSGAADGPHCHVQEWNGLVSYTRPPQHAFQGGKVVAAGTASEWGNYISIANPDGWITTYAHLSEIKVKVGQIIGGDMPTIADLGTVRKLAYSVMGYDGRGLGQKRPNALYGDVDDEIKSYVGWELSKVIYDMWELARAKGYRDKELPQIYSLAEAGKQQPKALDSYPIDQLLTAALNKSKGA